MREIRSGCWIPISYGKVIGAGMPVGAFGGRREIMEHIAPLVGK
nr:hypothetical protein [Candidatus Brachybacter algidus]